MWAEELETAKNAAVKAGKAIMEIYNNADIGVEYKSDHSPLTAADKEANRIILEVLKNRFPGYAVLSEEEKDDIDRLNNDYCFIVDPLDGTKEFIRHNGQFTVNIALAYRHKSVMGVIYVPVTEELFYAVSGGGSRLRDKNGEERELHVTDITERNKVRLVMSSSHNCNEMEELIERYKITNFIKMGSSLKGCIIAKGEAEVYYRYNPTMEWDTAAMQCIVEEAGAIFRQMDGKSMIYNRRNCVNQKGFYIINHEKNLWNTGNP